MKLPKGRTPVLALACLLATAAASALPVEKSATKQTSDLVPRSAFLARSNLVDVEIAPSGKAVAFLKRQGKSQSLWLLDTASGRRRQLARHSEATDLFWSGDSRWLFLQSPRSISAVPTTQSAGGGVMSLLGGDSGRYVLGPDRSRPAAMLLREDVTRPGERKPSSYRVLRLVPSRRPQRLFTSLEPIEEFVAATPSFVRVVAGDRFSIRRLDSSGRSREVLRCVRLERCSILSSPRPGELVLAGDIGGNLGRLILMDRSGKLSTLHQDPMNVSDLAATAIDPQSGQALLASYRSAVGADYAVAPAIAEDVAAIRRQLAPGATFRIGAGQTHWLVAETGDRLQHPRWRLYDRGSRHLVEILEDVEAPARRVPPTAAAERVPFSYRASDGMLIHGFLSLPDGRRPSELSLLVNVHGGPWSNVEDGYSTVTQFLVNRGYAVFEPNFRGSTGYGRAYMFAGKQDFGNGRVQADIVEGTRHLLDRGIGDPKRVGIIGSSFGGYSALQGITFSPGLFRVAVAGMPPSDFGWVMRWQVDREAAAGGRGMTLQSSLKHLGIDPTDPKLMERLRAQSPANNVTRLGRPVLIVAGGQDQSVPIRSVADYAARLKWLGQKITLFVDPKSGHSIQDSAVQEQFLYLVSTMLHRHLSGAAEPPLNSPSMVKLRRKLRLDDWNLIRSVERASAADSKSRAPA